MIRCLLKVFIREMSEAELHLQLSYQERALGSCGGEARPFQTTVEREAVSLKRARVAEVKTSRFTLMV